MGIGIFVTYLLDLVRRERDHSQQALQERQDTLNRLIAVTGVCEDISKPADLSATVSSVLETVA